MPLALACMFCGAVCKQLRQRHSVMWGSCVSQGWGAAVTDSDVAGIKAALEEFLVKALLPALQARVRGLHFQVRPAAATHGHTRVALRKDAHSVAS